MVKRLEEEIGKLWAEWDGVEMEIQKAVGTLEKLVEEAGGEQKIREVEERLRGKVEEICEEALRKMRESEMVSSSFLFLLFLFLFDPGFVRQ